MSRKQTARGRRTQKVQLIKGTFDPENARHLLLSLLNYKISFHEVRRLGETERFGRADPHGKRRIAELKASRQAVVDFLGAAARIGARLRIESDVKIRTVR